MSVVRDEITGEASIVCCVCRKPAPPVREIMKAHGLNSMGWRCSGGSHLCPEHNLSAVK